MTYFYLPNDIAEDYKYLVPSGDYYDLYDTDTLSANTNYRFYRFYKSVAQDYYLTEDITPTNSVDLDCIEIMPTHDYVYRNDYKDIVNIVFVYVIGFIFLLNIFTSIIKKGGVLGGLI